VVLRRGAGIGSARNIAFIAIMGALGNVLSWLSISLAPFLPEIPLGPLTVSIALDLSHLTTFIAALYGGPAVGGLVGLVGGAVAANVFGFSSGNLVTGFTLPIGKALTGLTAGLLMRALGLGVNDYGLLLIASKLQSAEERGLLLRIYRILLVPSTVLSYLPEAVFTVFIFLSVIPFVYGIPVVIFYGIVTGILVKAFIEMFVEGAILAALSASQSFTISINNFFKA